MISYTAYWNGQPLQVRPCRVSAAPINRVWPGKQRDIEQSELAYFVSFDMEQPGELELRVEGTAIESLELRPLEWELPRRVEGNVIRITLEKPCYFTVEINGTHQALQVFADEPEQYEYREGDLYFGPGEHDAGLILPKSGQRVYFHRDAVVYGALLFYRVENVQVLGRGVLDSSRCRRGVDGTADEPGSEVRAAMEAMGLPEEMVRYMCAVVAYESRNLTMEGIILQDSMLWTLTLRNHCRNVDIHHIKIIGQWRYNADGIDICNSENVTVRDCYIRSFDDCVVTRGAYLEGETGNARNILVENCVLWCDWGISMEIWMGHILSSVQQVTYQNNHLIHLCHNAFDIATWFGSTDTVVEDVRILHNIIDPEMHYPFPVYQNEEDQVYQDQPGFRPNLIKLYVGNLGKRGLTQQALHMDDTSHFRSCYRNIRIEGLTTLDHSKLPIVIYGPSGQFRLEDVKILDCDGEIQQMDAQLVDFTCKLG